NRPSPPVTTVPSACGRLPGRIARAVTSRIAALIGLPSTVARRPSTVRRAANPTLAVMRCARFDLNHVCRLAAVLALTPLGCPPLKGPVGSTSEPDGLPTNVGGKVSARPMRERQIRTTPLFGYDAETHEWTSAPSPPVHRREASSTRVPASAEAESTLDGAAA